MSTPNNRRRDPGGLGGETLLLLIVVLGAVAAIVVLNVAVRLGHQLDGTGVELPSDPFAFTLGVILGRVPWPASATWIVIVLLAIVLALVVLAIVGVVRYRKGRTRVDRASSYMGRGKDVEGLSKRNAQAQATRLGVTGSLGVPIGKTLGQMPLYGTWEDMHIDIWGPRTGKTTSRAVPAILEAPGGVLVTSNKRDVVDATRDVRAEAGPVWVFDPQGIALEQPTWWWNPLSYVTDEVRAAKLDSGVRPAPLPAAASAAAR